MTEKSRSSTKDVSSKYRAPRIAPSHPTNHQFRLDGLPIRRHGIILSPNGQPWESKAVLNAAAVLNYKVHIFYRAFGPDSPEYSQIAERPSSIGIATSIDGMTIDERSEEPILRNAEDPRIVRLNGVYAMTYTDVARFDQQNGWTTYATIATTTDLRHFQKLGRVEVEGFRDVNKNVVLFPGKINERYTAFARQKPDMFVVQSGDLVHWDTPKFTMGPREGYWDDDYIGPGAPPIKTPYGWINFYHGVDRDRVYRLGVALHDLNDPSKVLARAIDPLLEPTEDYEIDGITGKPPHRRVVYTCGSVTMRGSHYVYYGAADEVLALATVPEKQLEERMKKSA